MLALLLGVAFGFVGSIPVAGPIALLVFAYGVSKRSRSALFLAAGGALAESAYALLAFWGMSRLLDRFPNAVPDSRGLGAVVIFALGLTFVRKKTKETEQKEHEASDARSFALGFTLTALNPTLIVTWTAATTTLFSTGWIKPTSLLGALPFAGGAFVGIVGWFAVLLLLLHHYRDRLKPQTMNRIVRYVGFALIGLSLYFAVLFVQHLVAAHLPR